MVERYIELNELTGPYLRSLRNPGLEELKVLRGLVHDRKWWSRFSMKSPEKKLRVLGIVKDKDIGKWVTYLESKTKP